MTLLGSIACFAVAALAVPDGHEWRMALALCAAAGSGGLVASYLMGERA